MIMKKRNFLFVALAGALMATSCSTDDADNFGSKTGNSKIIPNASVGFVGSRAIESTTANLTDFYAYAYQSGSDNYMNHVLYSKTGTDWGTQEGNFFWPADGSDLYFVCYAPNIPGQAGDLTINSNVQQLADFSPKSLATEQQDFIYCKAAGNKNNEGGVINLNFKHALSEVTVAAKNENTAYEVKVTGVELGNIKNKATFTFPTIIISDGTWQLSTNEQDKENYTTSWSSAETLGQQASNLGDSNVPFMLIPQQLTSETVASNGNYIALKVQIKMAGGAYIMGDAQEGAWVYIPINTNWEMGKHYAYTLDFSEGAGQKFNGDPVISGSGIKVKVTVTDWAPQDNPTSAKTNV